MSLLQYVHPLQGTDSVFHFSNGNTLPLVAMPFGMASFSPQTNEAGEGWFFHPSHRHFQGIRLTHQPSPWIRDYGHLVIMPQTGALSLPAAKRSSSFRPEETVIKPDYFRTRLLRYQTTLELTPTVRCASIRATFQDPDSARFIVAPFEGESAVSIDPGLRRVTGLTRAKRAGAPDNFAMYYVLEFDCDMDTAAAASGTFNKDYEASGQLTETGDRVGAYIGLVLPDNGVVNVRMGTSFISVEQAIHNLAAEIGPKSFEEVRKEAAQAWEAILNRIHIEDEEEVDKRRTFYTCLYRTCLFPRTWYEFNEAGEKIHYSPYTGNIHNGPMFSDNGFWDTYRTNYPLYSILLPSLLGEILEAWVNVYKEGGWMPKWVSPGERSAMPGTLIDAVFADAHVKGIRGFDLEAAYAGLYKHAAYASDNPRLGRRGLEEYKQLGYIPCDSYHESVSNTLDYVYGDFCIAQLAKDLGKQDEYKQLMDRSRNYSKLFDPATGFMRARRKDGSWNEPFDPMVWGGAYCEGGAWQCSWAVQHDLLGLAKLQGGREAFYRRLQELMTAPPDFKIGSYGFEIHEMSEMASIDFGQFAISNQPSFHIPYIFAAIGYPSETQYWVRKAMDELFSYRPDGLPGDEDNGSLGAWYIFGAMGLYPLCPGVPEYVIGSPLFKRMVIYLENGAELVIEAANNSETNPFVESVRINGENHQPLFVTHDRLLSGGCIQFKMTSAPVPNRYEEIDLPFSLSKTVESSKNL
ncbi:MAG: alpha 2-mannosidase [Paenibacillus sp.]|jgi:predicted alpha-1,2-mannosidase|nr:alpha 2-mannosidase [Paenibacillus sp.]